jgi:hypothetical protein
VEAGSQKKLTRQSASASQLEPHCAETPAADSMEISQASPAGQSEVDRQVQDPNSPSVESLSQ